MQRPRPWSHFIHPQKVELLLQQGPTWINRSSLAGPSVRFDQCRPRSPIVSSSKSVLAASRRVPGPSTPFDTECCQSQVQQRGVEATQEVLQALLDGVEPDSGGMANATLKSREASFEKLDFQKLQNEAGSSVSKLLEKIKFFSEKSCFEASRSSFLEVQKLILEASF